jgi:hypothetical protein
MLKMSNDELKKKIIKKIDKNNSSQLGYLTKPMTWIMRLR